MSRSHELAVFGATGYTGREAVAYLAARAARLGLRWAVAGRDERALAGLVASLPEPRPAIMVADATDPSSLAALAADAVAVISFAGPHAPLGDELPRQCVLGGAHYADLCGENDAIARRLARLDEPARESGVKSIPACGYESVPFDLGALGLHRVFRNADGSRLEDVAAEVRFVFHRSALRYGHGNSGGTLATVTRLVEDRGLSDRYRFARAAGIADAVGGEEDRLALDARRSPGGDWLAPLIPTPFLNPAIVHLSSAQLGTDGYSSVLAYREGVNASASLGSQALGAIGAKGASALVRRIAAMSQGRRNPGDRAMLAILKALTPKPGSGPSRSSLDALDYRIEIRARSTSGLAAGALIEGTGHPGYRSAANILAEAGIALARADRLPDRSGVLTPASGLGLGFVDSLPVAGLSFDFGEQVEIGKARP